MVRRALRPLHPLTAARGTALLAASGTALTVALLSAACGAPLANSVAREGIAPDAVVRLDERRAVAARLRGGQVEVVAFVSADGAAWSAEVVASGAARPMSPHLVAHDGQTGQIWNALFFGTAPDGASRVVLDRDAAGGQVTDGAWVLVLPERGITPDDLAWRILDAQGATLASGIGLDGLD